MPVRVVVVHDDRRLRGALVTALTAEGHNVEAFSTPLSAAEATQSSNKVDLFVAQARGKEPGVRLTLASSAGIRSSIATVLNDPVAPGDIMVAARQLLSSRTG
jgi:DNA-binding NtrC family response regulator